MLEPDGGELVEYSFAAVSEGRVAEIVAERDGFGKILVEGQRAGDGAGYLRYVESVREAGDVVVAFGRKEHLRFVFKARESFGIYYPGYSKAS